MKDAIQIKRLKAIRRVRISLSIFIFGLVLAGITAIPLQTELIFLTKCIGGDSETRKWFLTVKEALVETNRKYPFISYGTDWLAFGHFIIAIAFIGPMRNPVKNIWVVHFGMIACSLVIPFAFIMGSVRGIPLSWRLIDCSFGVIGLMPLGFALWQIRTLAALSCPPPVGQPFIRKL